MFQSNFTKRHFLQSPNFLAFIWKSSFTVFTKQRKKKKKYIGNLNSYKDVDSHDPFGHNMATPLCMVMLSISSPLSLQMVLL